MFHKYHDVSLLFLRVTIAVIFVYAGMMKLGLWDMAPSEQMSAGMLTLMKVLSIVEPIAGLAVLLGFHTEASAIALSVVMLGAIWVMSQVMGVGFATESGAGWEFPLMVLAGLTILLTQGPGKYALRKE